MNAFEPAPDTKLVDNDDELTVKFIEEPIYDPMNQKPNPSFVNDIKHENK